MIVNKLTDFGVIAVTLGLRTEGADHLGMTANTSFSDVNIASEHFKWRVRLNAGNGRNVFLDEEHRYDFD